MKKETAIKRTFKRINKEYPLLRKSLRAYFVEIIILTYENFQLDSGYDDMTDTEKLNYSYEINTIDEYHAIIWDFDNNMYKLHSDYYDLWNTYRSMLVSR